jgi:hypothetical protein
MCIRILKPKKPREAFRVYYDFREGTVGDQPALEVFKERLDGMGWPEFRMLAAFALNDQYGSAGNAHAMWFRAVDGHAVQPCEKE